MVEENCKITKIENTTIDETISLNADIEFNCYDFKGALVVSQFKPQDEWIGVSTVTDVKNGEIIAINGMDVLVFEQQENCTIIYKDRTTEYRIYLYCDFVTAKKFAKTIK